MKKYSIDSCGRLNIQRKHERVVCDGNFNIDAKNRLIYLLNEPDAWKRKYGLGPDVRFEGKWQIDDQCNLELALGRREEGPASLGSLKLKSKIISVDNDTLTFEVHSRDRQGNSHVRLIKLSGAWQADERNRLTFTVQKRSPDVLALEGAWQVNKNQQIVYKYEKTGLKSGAKAMQTLVFTGFWDISEKNRLTYILSGSSRSRFDFRVQAGSPSMYPQEGKIKYHLGAGVRQEMRPKAKVVYLYGSWKFSRSCGFSFEMDYGRGRVRAIKFGAQVRLNKQDDVVFALANNREEPLGISVTFSHQFLKSSGAEAFLRLKTGRRTGSGIDIGARIPF
ncbi:MAG: hypothetical protein Q8O22_06930 [Candidatus Omnitrophota bacterium]|nr:hypothetical protein [Candidatus Omnitrophota bacterium]